MRRALVGLAAAAAAVTLSACGGGDAPEIDSSLSDRDQELCGLVLDDEEPLGYLAAQVDELIDRDGAFSSSGDAQAFVAVAVDRAEQEIRSRVAGAGELDSEGFIDDPELILAAKAVQRSLFDLRVAADEGSSVESRTLNAAESALDDMADLCTGD